MALWVPFLFGIGVGALIGFLLGRQRRPGPLATPAPTPRVPASSNPVTHVALDERSANVLNALNNRLAAIGALTDLLSGSALDPDRARALASLHGEVRRAAEITEHFLELAEHPQGATEPSEPRAGRSEEHTSELQSPYELVCRLRLEKKKDKQAERGERARNRKTLRVYTVLHSP